MTKEMRPSHRIDVLTDAILYYAEKLSQIWVSCTVWFELVIILLALFREDTSQSHETCNSVEGGYQEKITRSIPSASPGINVTLCDVYKS